MMVLPVPVGAQENTLVRREPCQHGFFLQRIRRIGELSKVTIAKLGPRQRRRSWRFVSGLGVQTTECYLKN